MGPKKARKQIKRSTVEHKTRSESKRSATANLDAAVLTTNNDNSANVNINPNPNANANSSTSTATSTATLALMSTSASRSRSRSQSQSKHSSSRNQPMPTTASTLAAAGTVANPWANNQANANTNANTGLAYVDLTDDPGFYMNDDDDDASFIEEVKRASLLDVKQNVGQDTKSETKQAGQQAGQDSKQAACTCGRCFTKPKTKDYFTQDNQDLMLVHFLQMCDDKIFKVPLEKISSRILRYGVEYWIVTNQFPSLDELAVLATLYNLPQILTEIPPFIGCDQWFTDLYKFQIANFGHDDYKTAIQQNGYWTQTRRYATEQQLKVYLDELKVAHDPTAGEVVKKPTQHLDKLLTHAFSGQLKDLSNDACPICMENFKVGDKYHKLPCEHLFHAKDDNCPGLLGWLESSDKCPICRVEIKL